VSHNDANDADGSDALYDAAMAYATHVQRQPDDMTEADWRDLAMVALDQAGMNLRDQHMVRTMLKTGGG
jgi:hypothetical protein